MKLRHVLSIVVLFVTGLNIISLATSSSTSSSTASGTSATNSTISSTSSTTTSSSTTNTTLSSTTTTTMSPTTTPMSYTCFNHTCAGVGCLKINETSIPTCSGKACKTEQFSSGTNVTITASCDNNCMENNCTNPSSNTRTCCCKADRCNKEITSPSSSGSSVSPTLFLMLSIFQFLIVKKEL